MNRYQFKAIRKVSGLSMQELADLLRIKDKSTIYRYEAGTRSIPGPVSLLMEMLERREID